MTTKKMFGYRLIKSTQLGRALSKLGDLYREKGEPEFLVIPYVLTCAAFLEARLNDAFLDLETQFGEPFADAMQSLSMPKKLVCLVPALTSGEYEINKDHFVYQRLVSLIRIRNTIAHAKSETREIEVVETDMTTPVSFQSVGPVRVPHGFFTHIPEGDETLGASKTFSPGEYHDALNKLEKWFFLRCPDRLSKIEMVKVRDKSAEWNEVSTVFEKELK
jgi:hypothetical protein